MEKSVDQLVRQQYLVPRRSVVKLRQLSKSHRVSATEIVRRAIDAYDPQADEANSQQRAALELLSQVHGELRKVMRRIDADLTELHRRQRALEDGSVQQQARRDAENWLRRNPQALDDLAAWFGAAATAPDVRSGGKAGGRAGGGAARMRALRR